MRNDFLEMAIQAFSFLEDAGFRCTKNAPSLLCYESDLSFVTVSWDARSGELDASIGLLPQTGQVQDGYSIADVLGFAGLPESNSRPAQVADISRLEPFVATLANNVYTYAQPALAGDRGYFQELETFRNTKAATFMQDMKLQQMRSEVQSAWRKRQYDRVVNLYAPMEGHLTKSEARKLEYARQHLLCTVQPSNK
jgi:hypothetical protein